MRRTGKSDIWGPLDRWDAAGGVLLFLLGTALIYIRSGYLGDGAPDYACLLDRSYRVSLGQVIYRDFHCATTPLCYLVQGLLFRLFGCTLAVTRWYLGFQGAAAGVLTFLVCRRWLGFGRLPGLGLGLAAVLWSIQMVTGLPWYDSDALFFAFAAVPAFMAWWESGDLRAAFLVGVFASLSFTAKQDLGAAALILSPAVIALKAGDRKRSLAALAAGALLTMALFAAYLGVHGALQDAWYWFVGRALFRWGYGQVSLARKVFLTLSGDTGMMGKVLLAVYAAAVALPLWRMRRSSASEADASLRNACAALYLGGIYYAGYLAHLAEHFEAQQTGLACALGVIGCSLRPRGRSSRRPGAPAWGSVAFALFAALLAARSLKYTRQNALTRDGEPMQVLDVARAGGVRLPRSDSEELGRLVAFLKREIPPEETFIEFPVNQSYLSLYYLTDRVPPHPVTAKGVIETIPRLDAKPIIAAVEKGGVRWVVAYEQFLKGDFAGWPGLGRYILEEFEPYRRPVPGVVLLRRRERPVRAR